MPQVWLMGSGVGKPNGYQTTHFSATLRATSSTPTPQPQSGQGSSTSGDNPQSPHHPQDLRPSTSSQQTNDAEMVCEACSASFNLFKRKHRCLDCDKFFCANCIHKEPRKCCFTCRIFEGLSTRGDVMGVKIKDLRQFLSARNISIETCREKADLVDLVMQHLGLPTAPQILPIDQTSSTRDLPDRQSDTSATSTSAETIPITEPNSLPRPTQSSGIQETTGQPTVHIYGETPLGPLRHAWNDSSPEAQSEASPENSQGMDEPEFPEIINIPTQQENTESTTTSQSQTQQSQVTGDSPPTPVSNDTQGDNSAGQTDSAEERDSVSPAPASNASHQGSTQASTEQTQATEAKPNLIKECEQQSDQPSSHHRLSSTFDVIVNIPQDEPGPESVFPQDEPSTEPVLSQDQPGREHTETFPQQSTSDQSGAEELPQSQHAGTEPVDSEMSPEQAQTETSTEVPRRQRASVSDLKSALDIESLSIKQLKEILARNFVDYKGCVERYELEERVTRLFNEKESFRQKEGKAAAEKNDSKGTNDDILDLDPEICCKICMDAPIDCVLLECGHMVTCSKCGKRLAECPICRQYVVRAVHVFKS